MTNSTAAYIYDDAEAIEELVDSSWFTSNAQPSADMAIVQHRTKLKGLTVNTLLSERQLNKRGLILHPHEAQTWLIDADADTLEGPKPCEAWQQSLSVRLEELRDLAEEEELKFSQGSADLAWKFAVGLNAEVRPGAFLLSNGNVRLLWSRNREQIGLQFHENGIVQFVLFVDRGGRVSTLMGDDWQEDIARHIASAGLRHLLKR